MTRGKSKVYVPAIRAAREWGRRPTEVIFGDYYALNRDVFNGEPNEGEPLWDSWDYCLLNAFQLLEDFTDEYGIAVWERDSDDVNIYAQKKIHPFLAARDKWTNKKNYTPSPGEYFVPKVELHSWVDEWPTFQDWVEAQIETEAEESEED